jgi:hypothetical protein
MMQLDLFETKSFRKAKDKTAFSDPNFASNKVRPIHRWVPWIAGFSSDFVKDVLDKNLASKGVVLDPFAGVGTTLVEAASAGHDVIGFEINPYASLASKVKVNVGQLDVVALREAILALTEFYNSALSTNYEPHSTAPDGFKTRVPFFSSPVLKKVLIIQDFINSIPNPQIAETFQLAFAATMVGFSNYSYEPSLGTRRSVGKSDIEDFNVIQKLLNKLNEIATDIKQVAPALKNINAKIINDSFFNCTEYIEGNTVDLCVTSPPYLNNYHYIRNTRPQLYWLGFVKKPSDTEFLERENFGKYWQTVRELAEVKLDFPSPPPALVMQLAQLRSLRTEKGIYGGNGWANYAASYFNDCYRFAKCIKYALRDEARAFVVIGNSILQGLMIPTDEYLGAIAELAGLKLLDIHLPRLTRVGNSIIQSNVRVEKADDGHQLYEAVVELIKLR